MQKEHLNLNLKGCIKSMESKTGNFEFVLPHFTAKLTIKYFH